MRFILASSSPRRREMIASLGIDFTIIKPEIDETQRPGEDPYAYVKRLSREKADAVVRTSPPDPLSVYGEGEKRPLSEGEEMSLSEREERPLSEREERPFSEREEMPFSVGESQPRSQQSRYGESPNSSGLKPLPVHGEGFGVGSTLILAADTIVLSADTIGVETSGALLGKPADHDEAFAMLDRLRDTWHTVCTAFNLVVLDSTGIRQRIADRVSTQVLMRPYSDAEIEAYIASGDPFDKAGGYAIQHTGFHPVARIEGCYNNVVGLPLCAVKRALVAVGWPGITASDNCDCPRFNAAELSR